MPLTQAQLKDTLASQASQVWLNCLTFTHPQIDTVRLVGDKQPLIRGGQTFLAFPFDVVGPTVDGTQMPQITITADVVDQRIIAMLRPLAGLQPEVTILWEVVTDSEPDSPVMRAQFRFTQLNVSGMTQCTIAATFLSAGLDDAFPTRQFSPSNAVMQ